VVPVNRIGSPSSSFSLFIIYGKTRNAISIDIIRNASEKLYPISTNPSWQVDASFISDKLENTPMGAEFRRVLGVPKLKSPWSGDIEVG
jgi:hypothetical protein